jgi:hypothetical protein
MAAMAGVHEAAPATSADVNARRDYAANMRATLGRRGINVDKVSDAELNDSVLYHLFPNFSMFKNPAGKLSYRFRPYRNFTDKCIYELMVLQPVPAGVARERDMPLHMLKEGETFEDYSDKLGVLGFLIDQDVENCPKIQRGLHSLDVIQLAKSQEANIIHFNDQLESYIRS